MKQAEIEKLKRLYKVSKANKVGAKCICPACGIEFIKVNYQQAFCKTKVGTYCKDYYWNNVTPTKHNNTTRISPANAAWMEERANRGEEDADADLSWDAHKLER